MPERDPNFLDETHSNSFTLWKSQGLPQTPTPEQIAELEEASKLHEVSEPPDYTVAQGRGTLSTRLARQGVTLTEPEWE